ncbi:LacI family DNA-binding transcriptional regulator [Paenibacillus thalictri]|uniref:LacI family transcriptional regulator n=1 Tax=Paenibacillus thalictri TaxID=2527873 RepID=A0A4Q9DFP3_9BACL|nr:LacI family DNA-binding transcriptional regulator [Paenibacillus thalictri]TBL70824.1 LacI family transcriptional regulator [Paenibacillus thalictri]
MNIREIAQLCGVSTSTVSRILNNKPDVSQETRDKVIGIMNQMNFLPTVTTNSRQSIGIVTPLVMFPEFMGELMNGIMEAAFSLNQTLTLIPIVQTDAQNIMHFCRSNSLHGMIVINPPLSSRLPEELKEHEIPHIILAATIRDSEISWVDVDNLGGTKEAVNHLIQLGHKRIALLHTKGSRCEEDRILGYKQALADHGIPLDPALMYEKPTGNSDLISPVSRLLQLEQPPTAFFSTSHRETLNLLSAFNELGVSVPERISLAGFGDYEVSALTKPPLTAVNQPIYEMGRAAVFAFQEILVMEKYEKRQIMLPTRLSVRHSTRFHT